jgi:hypothetical protein
MSPPLAFDRFDRSNRRRWKQWNQGIRPAVGPKLIAPGVDQEPLGSELVLDREVPGLLGHSPQCSPTDRSPSRSNDSPRSGRRDVVAARYGALFKLEHVHGNWSPTKSAASRSATPK